MKPMRIGDEWGNIMLDGRLRVRVLYWLIRKLVSPKVYFVWVSDEPVEKGGIQVAGPDEPDHRIPTR